MSDAPRPRWFCLTPDRFVVGLLIAELLLWLSELTKHSGLADAELQLITGHARRETLALYQHVAVDRALAERYQHAMKDVGL